MGVNSLASWSLSSETQAWIQISLSVKWVHISWSPLSLSGFKFFVRFSWRLNHYEVWIHLKTWKDMQTWVRDEHNYALIVFLYFCNNLCNLAYAPFRNRWGSIYLMVQWIVTKVIILLTTASICFTWPSSEDIWVVKEKVLSLGNTL